MIVCRHISKSYKKEKVINDFSYVFHDTGFYLLFGESGSGKTTMLNVLAGYIPFDSGTVEYDGAVLTGAADSEEIDSKIEYITQEPYFIDYLSVYDNLSLCTADDGIIYEYLKRFGMSDKKDQFPKQLSGGERQRLSLIRALIQNKSVILLDEPTASLDRSNKILIFETLKQLKDSVLIICSSHDAAAKEYADERIDFNNLERYRELAQGVPERYRSSEAESESVMKKRETSSAERDSERKRDTPRKPGPYIRKWFSSPQKEQKSKVRLSVILFFVMIGVCLGDIPQSKLDSSVEHIYGINQLQLSLSPDRLDYIETLRSSEKIKEIDLVYNLSVPDGISEDSDDLYSDVTYDVTAWTLPENEEYFHITDAFAYGGYFTDENQVILSDAMAAKFDDPEMLIGSTLNVELYDGVYEMTIVGITREFTATEKQYLSAGGIAIPNDRSEYDEVFFLSAAYTKRYIDDPDFVQHKNRTYVLQFDSYRDMKSFYNEAVNENGVQYIYANIDVSMEFLFVYMFICIFPIAVMIMFVAILFFQQTQKNELLHNRKVFTVFHSLGYPIKKVRRIWLAYSVKEFLGIFVFSGILSAAVMMIVNAVNNRLHFVPFQIFSYNVLVLILLAVVTVMISVLNSFFVLRRVKPENRNDILLEQRDLL